jgi:2-polyprenyl-3-methyl-5-hydroxy-6-metoxy-1,4-benzoquinol methylase
VCCGSGRVRHEKLPDRAYGVEGDWNIFECEKCGSAWLGTVPVPEDLVACYAAAYYTHQTPEPVTLGSSPRASVLRRLVLSERKGYKELAPNVPFSKAIGSTPGRIPRVISRACFGNPDLLPEFKPGGSLLEIGCGGGRFLSAMKLLGWDVYGIEPDPIASDVARNAAQCPIHNGTIEDDPFDPGQFDVIVSSHVIEHAYNPMSFLASAGRLLAKGGTIRLLTPNYASLGHRAFESDWYCLDPPRHMCLFTPRSLRRLFEESGGFSNIRIRMLTQASGQTVHRRNAVRRTGNFLGETRRSVSEPMFAAIELAGNFVFRWGEEIFCTAVKI